MSFSFFYMSFSFLFILTFHSATIDGCRLRSVFFPSGYHPRPCCLRPPAPCPLAADSIRAYVLSFWTTMPLPPPKKKGESVTVRYLLSNDIVVLVLLFFIRSYLFLRYSYDISTIFLRFTYVIHALRFTYRHNKKAGLHCCCSAI